MTKEEAIETIKDICLTTEQLTRIEKALECLLSQPSLPSNLDETAKSCLKEALQKFYDTIGKPYALVNESEVDEFGEFLFKAGAEWMAGQYKTLGETEIYLEDDGGEPPYTQEWLDLTTTEFRIPDGFKPGDKVIVQIRKKQ